jgi:hypothetical protein
MPKKEWTDKERLEACAQLAQKIRELRKASDIYDFATTIYFVATKSVKYLQLNAQQIEDDLAKTAEEQK